MAMSRSSRITLLLVIDILFFFLELLVGTSFLFSYSRFASLSLSGYAVGSLALVADSFHMLKYVSFNLNLQTTHCTPNSSDVMSLIVALYAIRARHSRFFLSSDPLMPLFTVHKW